MAEALATRDVLQGFPQGRRRERCGPEDLRSLAQDDWLRLGEVELKAHVSKHVATKQ